MHAPARSERPPADVEEVWREFHDALLAFIARRVRPREAAEDLLQEVMLRIQRNAAGLERAEAVGAWVHAIARNAIVDHYRSAAARREVAGDAAVDPDELPEPEPDPPGAREELARCVAPLLRRLSPSFREALELTELEGLTQEAAAARVGLSLSGMKSRVQRARRSLRQVLVECCEVERDARGGLSGYRPRAAGCDCAGPDVR